MIIGRRADKKNISYLSKSFHVFFNKVSLRNLFSSSFIHSFIHSCPPCSADTTLLKVMMELLMGYAANQVTEMAPCTPVHARKACKTVVWQKNEQLLGGASESFKTSFSEEKIWYELHPSSQFTQPFPWVIGCKSHEKDRFCPISI